MSFQLEDTKIQAHPKKVGFLFGNKKNILYLWIMERILCAAIWYKDLELKKPEVLEPRGYRPYNVDKGIVFSGWRHSNCLYQMVAMTGLPQHQAGEEIQGFLTNQNRFVDREEVLEIAYDAGQLKNLDKQREGKLFSEDLY